ncbi:MAG: hypothetical protein HYT19_00260 [Candidatus Nealsonbacteria bacterium]|nr:hypothetical protein [Candidatus Nealsonbacteria bacterium]
MEQTITISKDLIKEGELILIPRKKYEELLNRQKVTERDILRWANEAKFLKKIGKLPRLESWSNLNKK